MLRSRGQGKKHSHGSPPIGNGITYAPVTYVPQNLRRVCLQFSHPDLRHGESPNARYGSLSDYTVPGEQSEGKAAVPLAKSGRLNQLANRSVRSRSGKAEPRGVRGEDRRRASAGLVQYACMSTTRSVRPTDLVALVSLDGRVYLNEARTWGSLGRRPEGPRLLDSGIAPWFSFASGRHTWISVQGQAIRGLISARRRGNRTAWEIDCLIAATEDEAAIVDLFGQLTAGAVHAGVLGIFLRLDAGSDVISPARRAGFVPYAEETLYRLDGSVPSAELPPELHLQPSQASDAFALYRHYNASVPDAVRRLEAPTFQQWVAMAEKRASGRSKRDYVVRRNEEALAYVCCSRQRSLARVDIAVHPLIADAIPGLIDLACSSAGGKRPLYCLARSYATALSTGLLRAGFEVDSEYIVLVKRTALPLAVTRAARARVAVANPVAAV